MVEIVKGDLMTSGKDIIVQQVNCIVVMGGGLARTIYERYPEVRDEYNKYIKKANKRGDRSKELLGAVHYVDVYDGVIVSNIFGQDKIAKGRHDSVVYTEYDKLEEGLKDVKRLAESYNLSVGIPYELGCGMANGEWGEVKKRIDRVFKDSGVEVEIYYLEQASKKKL